MAAPEQNIVGVIREYGKRLFGFIRRRVSSDADAEDVLQDVWYQFSRVADTEPIEQVSGWLFRVARNRVTDLYRKQTPDALEDYAYADDDGELHFKDLLLAAPDTPETEYFRQLFWDELFAALDELPQAQREVFVWNELEDQTFQEIADRTGENIKTLISRKRYAVQHLRLRLNTLYEEFIKF
ncbi:MAG: sigma-70 family RNA polymerase sigma factor [Saprospiraceae bacterium]